MDKISELLELNCISLDLQSKKRHEVIPELVEILASAGKIDNRDFFVQELLEREKLSSTGIGNGIAIPHKLTSHISSTVLALGKTTRGINFGSLDKKPVHLFFLILGPEGKHTEHLKLLSKLSRLLHDRQFCDQLFRAQSPSEVIALIKAKEEY